MKLFTQLLVAFFILCFGNAFGQPVTYSVKDGAGQSLGQMVINYTPSGYEATMNGKVATLEITNNTAVITMGKLIIKMPIHGNYYHGDVGQWHTAPITTSFGDKGYARMFYAGLTPNGRLYREELWLNGQLFNKTNTVIDHNDQIIWSVGTDSEGTLRLTRM